MLHFRWNEWNRDHATVHGVSIAEAEMVAWTCKAKNAGDNKFIAAGRGAAGRLIQVIYVMDPDGTAYIIHARPLTDREKSRWRRSQK